MLFIYVYTLDFHTFQLIQIINDYEWSPLLLTNAAFMESKILFKTVKYYYNLL